MVEWNQMLILLEGIVLTEQPDVGYWALSNNGRYTSKSMYEMIVDPGIKCTRMLDMWKSNMPRKIKKKIGCVLGVESNLL